MLVLKKNLKNIFFLYLAIGPLLALLFQTDKIPLFSNYPLYTNSIENQISNHRGFFYYLNWFNPTTGELKPIALPFCLQPIKPRRLHFLVDLQEKTDRSKMPKLLSELHNGIQSTGKCFLEKPWVLRIYRGTWQLNSFPFQAETPSESSLYAEKR